MCNIWRKPSGAAELSVAEIDGFLARTRGLRWVGLTGGEPFLREDLDRIVEAVDRRCGASLLAVHFATNGQLVERIVGLAQTLARAPRRWQPVFTVSFDGPPPLHDGIRGVEGAWERAVETLRLLATIRAIRWQVGFTLGHRNRGAFGATCAALERVVPGFRRDRVIVNLFQRSDFYYDNRKMPALTPAALGEAIDEVLREGGGGASLAAFVRSRYLRLGKRYARTGRCPVPCQALSSLVFLDPEGTLFPCAIFRRPLGTVRGMTGSLGELWRSAEARALRSECVRGRCPTCWNTCDAYASMAASPLRALGA